MQPCSGYGLALCSCCCVCGEKANQAERSPAHCRVHVVLYIKENGDSLHTCDVINVIVRTNEPTLTMSLNLEELPCGLPSLSLSLQRSVQTWANGAQSRQTGTLDLV
jgi:hypothetical protein